ncbi:MAG: shikimate kinase, partial [Candidatus Dormibacteraceae bacterium]
PGAVVALGGGAPLDDGNWALIRARAVTVWLDAPIEVLLARAEPESRPLLRGRSDHALRSLWEVRMARYQEADYRVDATPPSPEVAAEVIKLWPG